MIKHFKRALANRSCHEVAKKVFIVGFAFVYGFSILTAQDNPPRRQPWRMEPGTEFEHASVHDPVMIYQGDRYYVLSTGMGVSVISTTDFQKWRMEPSPFEQAPQWAIDIIPGFRGHIWAPDIIFHNGEYHLFYSCSAFAKNTSAIGHASTPTLDSSDPNYKWTDHGKILQSVPYRDMWNAIDPNIIIDKEGGAWMSFGSFWDGIKMVRLKSDLSTIEELEEWYSLCRRERTFELNDNNPGDGAVEAPFIYQKGLYYYLFVSFDYCCRGANSDYKIAVGRSEKVTGPYIDRDGNRMDKGGGTIVLMGNEQYAGVGHNAVVKINDVDNIVCHAYPKEERGTPIIIRPIEWDEQGWPIVKW